MKSLLLFFLAVTEHTWGQSPPGDVVGSPVIAYQGWFAAPNDGSPVNRWIHWPKSQLAPARNNCHFEMYPDIREYTKLYPTQLANFGNGQQARLFSSWDDSTMDLHYRWMVQYGIGCVALQRFAQAAKADQTWARHLNGIANKTRLNAEKYGRKFYIAYDVSDWPNFGTELIEDLDRNLLASLNIFNSTAYARQNGMVVVSLWGFGYTNRPDNHTGALTLINELKRRGCYVIGGVPRRWRTGDGDSLPNYMDVYTSVHMLQPWIVGSFGGVDGARNHQSTLQADFEFLTARGIDYQPVVFPGFSWSNWNTGARNVIPRLHGDFMWQQFVNLRQLGIKNVITAMFDEYDEGTAIAKAAEDSSMIPTDQWFLTLDADGVHVSSDFYLRLNQEGTRMVAGAIPLQATHSVPFTIVPNVGGRIRIAETNDNSRSANPLQQSKKILCPFGTQKTGKTRDEPWTCEL